MPSIGPLKMKHVAAVLAVMLSIFQAFNQFEREQTAENTRNRMISIAAAGGWPAGNPPFGYKRGAKHDNILKIDPRNSQIVKEWDPKPRPTL